MDTAADKDLPLKEDTRLLGRVLGDVLRAQTGESGFARIEAIRQTAIRFRRARPEAAAPPCRLRSGRRRELSISDGCLVADAPLSPRAR